jgi:hypothetical protein
LVRHLVGPEGRAFDSCHRELILAWPWPRSQGTGGAVT